MNDNTLLQLLRDDPERGLHEAIQQYGRPLGKIIASIMPASSGEDKEEVLQDCFVKLWQNRMRIETERSLKSYLYAIARNTAVDRLRQTKEIIYLDEEMTNALSDPENILRRIEKQELHQIFLEGIRELGEPKSQVFYMRYFLNMRVKEIAEHLDVREKKVENILSRDKKKLWKLLSEKGVERYDG